MTDVLTQISPRGFKRLARWSARATVGAKRAWDEVSAGGKSLSPAYRKRRDRIAQARAASERLFADIARSTVRSFSGRVLIDGSFDNPNYWFRASLMRAALGLPHAYEVGLLGQYRRREASASFMRLGVASTAELLPDRATRKIAVAEAQRLMRKLAAPEDVIHADLPVGFPGAVVYDWILKKQRWPVLRLDDPLLEDYLAEAIGMILASGRLIGSDVSLVLTSHCQGLPYAALAWAATAAGVPTLNLAGPFGTTRPTRLDRPEQIFSYAQRISAAELDAMTGSRGDALISVATAYLERRFAGTAGDLGSAYAYLRNAVTLEREEIASRFGWDPADPIVCVYASHWFDMPHVHGMENFRDFYDWIEATLSSAQASKQINWIIKNHPCEDWYGGVTLHDLLKGREVHHIKLAPRDWNNFAVTRAVDAVVTLHGTIGIEAATLGKPVLVADRGWYASGGFAITPNSRSDYLRLLTEQWWQGHDTVAARRRALLFAGFLFCAPDWQGEFVTGDDSLQDDLYELYPALLDANPGAITREISSLGEWFDSGTPYYHVWKLMRADGYIVPKVPVSVHLR